MSVHGSIVAEAVAGLCGARPDLDQRLDPAMPRLWAGP
jgi:hypothetical protein